MANCYSNCGGCTRCCGALNSLCGCRNYPYYTGPCPNACGCYPDYPAPIEPEPMAAGAIGSFYAPGPVSVAAGGSVALTAGLVNPRYFAVNGSSIAIRQPGTYRAMYTLNVPAGLAVNTVMTLGLNGATIAASGVDVETTADAATANFAGQAIFTARAGDALNLGSLSALNIPSATTNPVFTLILERIG